MNHEIAQLIARGAIFVINHSGGKDSQARLAARFWDALGHYPIAETHDRMADEIEISLDLERAS